MDNKLHTKMKNDRTPIGVKTITNSLALMILHANDERVTVQHK